ncbi:hypothetical protein [Corynebacterium pygosceleis]|uniref:hypothetical protein n=1 Tax=Corynebacterium pygosceleis TaxID=2800406 RepID=UPI001904EF1E|nr:hypothetical protein [Corynebacterium pygosceleis]MCL0120653.1 hypothetical protein [Corynebacterium pygosceleis]
MFTYNHTLRRLLITNLATGLPAANVLTRTMQPNLFPSPSITPITPILKRHQLPRQLMPMISRPPLVLPRPLNNVEDVVMLIRVDPLQVINPLPLPVNHPPLPGHLITKITDL